MDRALRAVLVAVMPYPTRFRLAVFAARLTRPLARLIPDARVQALLALVPKTLPPVSRNDDAQVFPALGPRKMRVALMTGCVQKALDTEINDATIRLLTRLGAEVVVPPNMGCCGALPLHMGQENAALPKARSMVRAVMAAHRAGPLDALVINTSGCGSTLKDYGHLLAQDPLAADATQVAGLARDVTEVIAALGLPQTAPKGLAVAYHAACSLQHGQKIKTLPKDLLTQAGFKVSEPADSHLCCGSAGTYNILQPEISGQLRQRKVKTLMARKPDVIAAGNLGCMIQIGQEAGVPVVHTVSLLDWATGGPVPLALRQKHGA
jgi:glycolate oxidase iron-sulfur subunit